MASVAFDRHLSSPVDPDVLHKMLPYWTQLHAPPSGLHKNSIHVRKAILNAKQQIASVIGASRPEEIYFTHSGAESLFLGLAGFLKNQPPHSHVILSAAESPSWTMATSELEKQGYEFSFVSVDSLGFLNIDSLQSALRPNTRMIATHAAQYEFGTLQPLQQIGEFCKTHGLTFFCDATRAAGWLPLQVSDLNIHLLAASPHRFSGPSGIGMLYVRSDTPIAPLISTASASTSLKPGMESPALIVGAAAAFHLYAPSLTSKTNHTQQLQQHFVKRVSQIDSTSTLWGPPPGPGRISNQLAFHFPGVDAETLILKADLNGYLLAGVSACHNDPHPAIFRQLGVDRKIIRESLSFGFDTSLTIENIDNFLDNFLVKELHKLRTPDVASDGKRIEELGCP